MQSHSRPVSPGLDFPPSVFWNMADYDATDTSPKPSDSDADTSEDEAEKQPVETLVAGRERRKTAGNRYDRDLILEEVAATPDEDADEVTLLFADNEEEEDEEFRTSDEEEDADMSSSDDDDQGPNAAPDDLEGEREIQKQAKQERAKKRRADLALTSVAGLRKKLKTDLVRPAALSSAPAKPSKKKERVTWVHDPDSGRSSLRKQTIAHRAETIARLKESEAQSRKLKAIKEQRDRERAKDAPKELTQADRLAEAARVERQNAKSLNRWEAMEKKRQEEQAAKLAALKNRTLEGPVISWWSARAEWIGPKLHKIGTKDAGDVIGGGTEMKKRGRKSKVFLEQQAAAKEADGSTPLSAKPGTETSTTSQAAAPTSTEAPNELNADRLSSQKMSTETSVKLEAPTSAAEPAADMSTTENPAREPLQDKILHPNPAPEPEEPQPTLLNPQEQENTLLKGIHEYGTFNGDSTASNNNANASAPKQPDTSPPSEEKRETPQSKPGEVPINATSQPIETEQRQKQPAATAADAVSKPKTSDPQSTEPLQSEQPTKTASTAAETPSAPAPSPAAAVPSASPPPAVAGPSGDPEAAPAPAIAPAPGPEPVVENSTRNLVILEKFEELPTESRQEYSFFFNTRKAAKPVKHSQELCPITTLPVRYRDPTTGIGYANVVGYKKLQELKQHGFVWSGMLGCYVGRDGGPVARGVPEGFVDK